MIIQGIIFDRVRLDGDACPRCGHPIYDMKCKHCGYPFTKDVDGD
jgi:ribosomal protein L37E